MTPSELVSLRKRLGMSRPQFSEAIGISVSRLVDYETGITRGKVPRPCEIPKPIELACEALAMRAAGKAVERPRRFSAP